MTNHPRTAMIEVMSKHLPPSASVLHLLDVNGETHSTLANLYEDIEPVIVSGDACAWEIEPDSMDAVLAYAYIVNVPFLQQVLKILRPGGRMIVIDPAGRVDQAYVDSLESAGFVRILVESALGETGVLIRGEKPHSTANTLDRIQLVARKDDESLSVEQLNGRYVHLLIRESPNKPVWARRPGEPVTWQAAMLKGDEESVLLGFSSLPRAVGFMQPAVLANKIQDVNKVARFSRNVVSEWPYLLLINPAIEDLDRGDLMWIEIDPSTAEAPDE